MTAKVLSGFSPGTSSSVHSSATMARMPAEKRRISADAPGWRSAASRAGASSAGAAAAFTASGQLALTRTLPLTTTGL